MNPQVAKSCALALVPSIFTLLLVQACGGSSDAVAQAAAEADAIEGTWESTITIRDCTSGAVLRSFKGMNTFHRGGTLSDTNNSPTVTRGPGMGTWKRNPGGNYTASFRFYRYNADGTLAGSQKVTRTTAMTDSSSTTGTISAQIIDTGENVLQTLCGSETSVRVF